jgi:hypothetical protein
MLIGCPASVNSSGPTYNVGELFRREQREAPAASHDTGQIARQVVVRLHGDAIAEPESRDDARVEESRCIVAREAWQACGHRQRAQVHRGGRTLADQRQQPIERRSDAFRAAFEVVAGQVSL